jgi:hypothetical protein
MAGLQEQFDHLREQFPVIKEHWRLFGTVALLAVIGTWFVANYFYSQRMSDYEAHISLLQDRLNTAQQNQAALSSTPPSQWRRLSDVQRNTLLGLFSKPENKFPVMVIYAMAESESRQYAAQFVDMLRSTGSQVFQREVSLTEAPDVGLMIGIADISKPTPEAKKFAELLKDAGIETHYTLWVRLNSADNAPVNFDLFVGPKPW